MAPIEGKKPFVPRTTQWWQQSSSWQKTHSSWQRSAVWQKPVVGQRSAWQTQQWQNRPYQQWTPQWSRPQQTGWFQPRNNDRRVGGKPEARMTYINEMIKAPKVLIVDENGEKLWVFSRDEALKRASSGWLDLVQLAYNPVEMICTAKIVDYGKYMYDKQKDEKEKKKTQKSKWSKEIKMSYTIWDNDLALKIQKAWEFLDDWYTVRFSVRLRWRERIFVEKVTERMWGVEQSLLEKWKSQGVKEEPNWISLFLLPKGK